MPATPRRGPAPGQRSFDDLGAPLVDVTFCVLDLETTGGDRHHDLITEIGAVKVRGGEVLGTFQTLVNPGRAIPPKIQLLTGLTDAIVAEAPRIESVLPSLQQFLGDAVFVGHNVRFDLGFVQAALERSGRSRWSGTVVDTVALARRLVRDEVPNCRLGTLADRFRLPHQPTHRALDDAWATTDLLHLLLERSAAHGVLGLDDLVAFARLGGHPQSAKLRLTADLPRRPGVYLFTGHGGTVLYAGKATNLRQRVRSYFGSDDRRKIGPMLRETQGIDHIELPDPLTAEVVEARIIARSLPRYNRRGTTARKYCYVRLDVDQPWPRLSITARPAARSVQLGPLPSRSMANLVVDALHTALPLRRCTQRLARDHRPASDAPICSAAQLGVARCPCSGTADPAEYAAIVVQAARTIEGDPTVVVERL
ncbi:MAG: DEDD exonuclease domain-containing protein, partial [Actinomycetota bacterium]